MTTRQAWMLFLLFMVNGMLTQIVGMAVNGSTEMWVARILSFATAGAFAWLLQSVSGKFLPFRR